MFGLELPVCDSFNLITQSVAGGTRVASKDCPLIGCGVKVPYLLYLTLLIASSEASYSFLIFDGLKSLQLLQLVGKH